ncbi:MAG: metal-dependent transcriptional regulator [Candidatus Heimdallarchaeota archaeon]|nr:metal-dependent transcriptional regulator [Candidatus Heimdallarchaeota archaeon]
MSVDPPKAGKVTETTENYLKRIYILDAELGKARMSDVAKTMGRSLSSTSEAVKRMAEEGLLSHQKYGAITLTTKGKQIAENVHDNYTIMHSLLNSLGVPDDVAVLDACSMEHSISKKTIETINQFVDYIGTDPDAKKIIDQFKKHKK